ncbi:Holliday junction resolvase RecU [Carboxydothermus ferrireducens]|uniref:Holliday junction resolvase RecU n=1 Tax=Carboxydothermus ferrireducens DSM 11255 TaxID=1119529 RepID=A0ABX2R7I8_9THEO|nr:Holliday junction resolvase RecU [Carboxydothermus ferrireducens]NYE57136.1 penicillin-binding protein-related factor A (putative recombinase) [Carboxydothermus ferrireducens DSM 11255]
MVVNIYANRGRAFEELFELAVAGKKYCYFQKQHNLWIPYAGKAFPAKGSPIDFIGVVKGIPVAVECKEVTGDRFPLSRLPRKEFDALKKFQRAGGKSFLAVMNKKDEQFSLIPFGEVEERYRLYLKNPGRRGYGSIHLKEFVVFNDISKLPKILLKLAGKEVEK